MRIEFNEQYKIFQLSCSEMSYAFTINEEGRLMNLHWGNPINNFGDYEPMLDCPAIMKPYVRGSYNRAEYRTGDAGDYGVPCLRVEHANGAETLRMAYKEHRITDDSLYVTMHHVLFQWRLLKHLRQFYLQNQQPPQESCTYRRLHCRLLRLPQHVRFHLPLWLP